jgi:peptide/nickel transport system ATP-binding protein
MHKEPLLKIDNLSISFISNKKAKEVIHRISYDLNKNEILGIVGESGSGKSVSSLAIVGLLPKRVSQISSGEIRFNRNNG